MGWGAALDGQKLNEWNADEIGGENEANPNGREMQCDCRGRNQVGGAVPRHAHDAVRFVGVAGIGVPVSQRRRRNGQEGQADREDGQKKKTLAC